MNPDLRCIVCEEWAPTLYIVGGIPFCERDYKSEIVSHAKDIEQRAMLSRRLKEMRRRKLV